MQSKPAKFTPRKVAVTKTAPAPTPSSDFTFMDSRVKAASVLIYGPEGVGKTSLLAAFPEVGFVTDRREMGIKTLLDQGLVDPISFHEVPKDWSELLYIIGQVSCGGLNCQTLAIENLGMLELLCFQHHCKVYYDNNWTEKGFYTFQQGPKNAAKTDWPDLLNSIQECVEAGISVVVSGHSVISNFKNPHGPDFDSYKIDLNKDIIGEFNRTVDAIWFYNFEQDVRTEERKGKQPIKGKGSATLENRFIYTQKTTLWNAKNRFGMEPVIDAGTSGVSAYNALKAAVQAGAK